MDCGRYRKMYLSREGEEMVRRLLFREWYTMVALLLGIIAVVPSTMMSKIPEEFKGVAIGLLMFGLLLFLPWGVAMGIVVWRMSRISPSYSEEELRRIGDRMESRVILAPIPVMLVFLAYVVFFML